MLSPPLPARGRGAAWSALLFCQNLIFWILFFAAGAVVIPIATLIVALTRVVSSHRVTMRRIRRSISWYGWTILCCGWPFARAKYRDFAPEQASGPFIFICNHRSASDPFLMALLPYECVQIVNIWPFKLPVLGIAARIAGYLSVREMPVEEFYEKGARVLAEGACIIAFPEGTRSGSRVMGPFNSSIFRLGQQCRATFVPLAISGNERIPPKGSLVLHPGRIHVDKLPAVTWQDYQDMDAFQLKNHVRRLLGEHLNRIEKDAA